MPSSSSKYYARFIPSEEVDSVTQWKFSAVDGSLEEPVALATSDEPQVDAELEAQQLALIEQACDEAFARGLAEGRAQATTEWQQRMDDYVAGQGREQASRVAAIVDELQVQLSQMQQHMASDVLQLACDIAKEVVRQELRSNPAVLEPVVQEAVHMLVAEGRPATVRLNPQDMSGLAALQSVVGASESMPVRWIADDGVSPGGCLVDSAGMVVDGTVQKRWARAVAALGVNDVWQEETHEPTS